MGYVWSKVGSINQRKFTNGRSVKKFSEQFESLFYLFLQDEPQGSNDISERGSKSEATCGKNIKTEQRIQDVSGICQMCPGIYKQTVNCTFSKETTRSEIETEIKKRFSAEKNNLKRCIPASKFALALFCYSFFFYKKKAHLLVCCKSARQTCKWIPVLFHDLFHPYRSKRLLKEHRFFSFRDQRFSIFDSCVISCVGEHAFGIFE